MDNLLIEKYFDNLSDLQKDQFSRMGEIYKEWNEKINVVSRKDIDNIYEHHILHSLAIAKISPFKKGDRVMDIGCGGGFPGVPLAVMYPYVEFHLVDSIGKKIIVVNEVCEALGIKNIKTYHSRAEEVSVQVDYVVSRAVTRLKEFLGWSWKKIVSGDGHGVIYLKGGDLEEEIKEGTSKLKKVESIDILPVNDFFKEEFFDTKKIIFIKKAKK
ncbi:MAG: 16S rRNA (guanine(527)-N(7))-methyltransferase RsmG [Bacteroidetes bacterium]|nr:16S rRNA (guanine(527)-N(7))-methyltransferase RsmG [Bacteroidota bacterium]